MKVCLYLRKSRADRDHPDLPLEDVLKNHEAMLLAFAEKNGLEIADIKKEVVSGGSLARRPEMLKLLEEVEDGFYDAVLVKDFDRLGRGSMMEQGIIIETFRKSETKIITPEKTYDLENELDEEYIDLSAFFARKELKMITKRLHSGRMKSVSDGNYISPYAPYGYDKQNKTLIVNEKEKDIVRLIFELYADHGFGNTRIAKYLNDHGIPGKHGDIGWDKTTIRNMLRNPVYTGKITWNKRVYRYQKNGKRTSRFLNSSEWKVYSGRHEAIIDDTMFEKAQQAARNKCIPHLHSASTLRNPIANLLRCGRCGAAMTIRTATGKADSLRCYKHCGGSVSSYIVPVEKRLVSLLILHFSDLEVPFLYSGETKKPEMSRSVLLRSVESLENRRTKLKMQMNNLCDLLEQGVYDRNTFLERSHRLTENLKLIEERIEAASVPDWNPKCNEPSKRNSVPCCGSRQDHMDVLPEFGNIQVFIRDIYWKLDPKNRNDFLKEMIGSVIYAKPKGAGKDGFTLDIILKE